MKRKTKFMIALGVILSVILIPLLINRIYSIMLSNSYPPLSNFVGKGYRVIRIPLQGKLDYQQNELIHPRSFTDTDTLNKKSLDYGSYIYMDTLNLNFKVVTKAYAGFNGPDLVTYITFDKQGEILKTEKYIPVQTRDYETDKVTYNPQGKIIERTRNDSSNSAQRAINCILIPDKLTTFPHWKNKSSPVYIRHFTINEMHLSELNPFYIGGMNNDNARHVWYGFSYCDFHFIEKTMKFRIPFAYDSLILNTDEYVANLQYYSVPGKFLNVLPISFIKLDDAVYLVTGE